jgi:putative oxidoreductase
MIDAAAPTGVIAHVTGRANAVIAWLERFPLALLQLAFRFAVGLVFFNSGLLKLNSWQFAVLLFRDEYKVPILAPEVAATIATTFELSCPVLLFVGLATRLATLPLLGMIAMIQTFVYPQAWPEHLMWSSILLFLLTRGPGPIALDRLFALHYGASTAGRRAAS